MKIVIKTWMYEKIRKTMNEYNLTPIAEEVMGGYSVKIEKITDHTAKANRVNFKYYKKAYGDEVDMREYSGFEFWIPKSALL